MWEQLWSTCATLIPTRSAKRLLAENIRSVNYRYRQNDPVPTYRHKPTYAGAVSPETTRLLTALDIIRLCQCLEYQSCEHPEWPTSWARTFLQSVVDTAVNDLPGYDDAPWGLYAPSRTADEHREAAAQLADASLPRVFATLADASLPDDVRRQAVAALLQGCTVADVLMHLRDACRDESKRYAADTLPHDHFARAASAIQHLRETTDI